MTEYDVWDRPSAAAKGRRATGSTCHYQAG